MFRLLSDLAYAFSINHCLPVGHRRVSAKNSPEDPYNPKTRHSGLSTPTGRTGGQSLKNGNPDLTII
jgi:hypothetical protein